MRFCFFEENRVLLEDRFRRARKMFYAAMFALKGREQRRAATALQQLTGVDLGGVASGMLIASLGSASHSET
jgi:hypothetical protein